VTKANGRPTKYKAEYAIQAEKLCRKGFIDSEIADFFEIAESTLNLWKNAHSEFMEALKKGKRHSDDKVVDALYGRALGYESIEVKEEDGDSGKKTTVTTKQIAGDTTAQIFWLKNRQPAEWRNNPEDSADQNKAVPINVTIGVKDCSVNADS
jgi:hypothetical protein